VPPGHGLVSRTACDLGKGCLRRREYIVNRLAPHDKKGTSAEELETRGRSGQAQAAPCENRPVESPGPPW